MSNIPFNASSVASIGQEIIGHTSLNATLESYRTAIANMNNENCEGASDHLMSATSAAAPALITSLKSATSSILQTAGQEANAGGGAVRRRSITPSDDEDDSGNVDAVDDIDFESHRRGTKRPHDEDDWARSGPVPGKSQMTAEEKRFARLMANRRSARESRERKKRLQADLEASIVVLASRHDELERENRELKAKIGALVEVHRTQGTLSVVTASATGAAAAVPPIPGTERGFGGLAGAVGAASLLPQAHNSAIATSVQPMSVALPGVAPVRSNAGIVPVPNMQGHLEFLLQRQHQQQRATVTAAARVNPAVVPASLRQAGTLQASSGASLLGIANRSVATSGSALPGPAGTSAALAGLLARANVGSSIPQAQAPVGGTNVALAAILAQAQREMPANRLA
uniref:BZIP domain-containing protein n=1 Tax=Odontella aurita TaxID=265563 RepID=A0A7S4MBP8_9STRA|mmetsp:Transcript_16634/g.47911  ORF Transcript_16634/g.47911 Transcript_16634/m.47911 type:complete len:401 (+) Transcript_16634:153-1355(+)